MSFAAPTTSFSRRATGPAFRAFTSMKVMPTRTMSVGLPSGSHTRYRAKCGVAPPLGGRDEGLLARDDLAGRARRGDGRQPGVREERQQEEADEEREAAVTRASAHAQAPSLPLPPSPALLADCATGALVCTWSNERNAQSLPRGLGRHS